MARIPIALSEAVSDQELDAVFSRVSVNGEQVDNVIQQIVDGYCVEIDKIVAELYDFLDRNSDISDSVLESYVLRIPLRLYYASTAAETLGVRQDIAQLVYKEAYNAARQSAGGTVADKDAQAQQQVNAEALTAVVYSRAAKMARAKLDVAFELLNAVKKVVSARISERSLVQSDPAGR